MNNPKGIRIYPSPYPVKDTTDRFQEFLLQHGATIYARIDQQAELQKAGQIIAPLEFILFGNPKAGGPLMAVRPLVALELPLKIIAWQDEENKVWVACNEASYIEARYGLPPHQNPPLNLEPMILKVLSN